MRVFALVLWGDASLRAGPRGGSSVQENQLCRNRAPGTPPSSHPSQLSSPHQNLNRVSATLPQGVSNWFECLQTGSKMA